MEPIGIKDALKKLLHPMNDIEIGTVNADGDAKGRNILLYYIVYIYLYHISYRLIDPWS